MEKFSGMGRIQFCPFQNSLNSDSDKKGMRRILSFIFTIKKPLMQRHPILYAFFLINLACYAQTNPASQKALSLQSNVVYVKAAQDVGFGFITGERKGKLYVVTAAHVLMVGEKTTNSANVRFYQDPNFVQAKVLFNDPNFDIALLEVTKPNDLKWQRNVRGKAQPGQNAAFIGRDGDWYIPLGASLGTINRLKDNHIFLDINSVAPGTSGAPVITASGIVGLILEHSGYEAMVLNLKDIKILLRKHNFPFQMTFEQYGLVGDTWYDEEGNVFGKVMKDGKVWMTKNLNLAVGNSWCYDDDPINCNKYGRLYNWEAAKGACAKLGDDWRLPTDGEWNNLRVAFGNSKKAYKALIEGGTSGFAAQRGGWRGYNGSFANAGSYGLYWSSSPNGSSFAWKHLFARNYGQLYRLNSRRDDGHSVRCLKDL